MTRASCAWIHGRDTRATFDDVRIFVAIVVGKDLRNLWASPHFLINCIAAESEV